MFNKIYNIPVRVFNLVTLPVVFLAMAPFLAEFVYFFVFSFFAVPFVILLSIYFNKSSKVCFINALYIFLFNLLLIVLIYFNKGTEQQGFALLFAPFILMGGAFILYLLSILLHWLTLTIENKEFLNKQFGVIYRRINLIFFVVSVFFLYYFGGSLQFFSLFSYFK